MSKSSRSKQSKSKKTQQKSQPSAQRSTARQKVVHKERGTVLTILLVVMALHGMFAAYFYYVVRTQEAALSRPMVISLMVVHSLANIAAAAGIWYWKKWALYVYGAGPRGGFNFRRNMVGILYDSAPGDRRVGAQDEMGIFYLTA